jgi:hypothetical protein
MNTPRISLNNFTPCSTRHTNIKENNKVCIISSYHFDLWRDFSIIIIIIEKALLAMTKVCVTYEWPFEKCTLLLNHDIFMYFSTAQCYYITGRHFTLEYRLNYLFFDPDILFIKLHHLEYSLQFYLRYRISDWQIVISFGFHQQYLY